MIESLWIALDAIRSHPARAIMTMLGVAIGVFVVTLLASVINGIRHSWSDDLQAAGVNTVSIARPYQCDGPCASTTLPEGDVDRLRAQPEVSRAAEIGNGSNTVAAQGRSIRDTRMMAVGSAWFVLGRRAIVDGRPFTEAEARSAAAVTVIDTGLSHLLFDRRSPVGRTITIGGVLFTVVGEYADPGFGSTPLLDDSSLPSTYFAGTVVPYRAARALFGTSIGEITVRPREGISRAEITAVVTSVLRAGHGLGPRDRTDFQILDPVEALAEFDAGTKTLRVTALSFASVGLLVGGIGVIAIMLISVTERTREIGVRKALGATRIVIAWQFLVEASVLTVLGALSGLAAGWIAVAAINRWTTIPAAAPLDAVAAALGVSVALGLIFGLLPAVRAAGLDPVEALRYE